MPENALNNLFAMGALAKSSLYVFCSLNCGCFGLLS
jgi:hypothetical protein